MGRRRKHKNKSSLMGIVVLIIAVLTYVKLTFLKDFNPFEDINIKLENPFKQEKIEVSKRSVAEDLSATVDEDKIEEKSVIKEEDVFVTVFFTKMTNGKDVYVAASRKLPKDCNCSAVEYAVKMLFSGPTRYERKQGVYSEVPSTTKLISYNETPSRININLSDDFGFGGGGDSLYKRTYQLIKTVNHNTRKPVYLYLNGKKADVIGGEGLMLKQPLRSNSLEE